MNMDKWNSLPADVQKVMDGLSVEQAEWTGNYMDNHVKESVDWSVKTQGVEIINLSAEETAKWNAKLQPLTDQWVADADSKGLPAEDIVKDMKLLIQKYSK
jgi:TRAP-type C4-dicarboxylate transport system substrate-binding protein